jgi:hypothetical protein
LQQIPAEQDLSIDNYIIGFRHNKGKYQGWTPLFKNDQIRSSGTESDSDVQKVDEEDEGDIKTVIVYYTKTDFEVQRIEFNSKDRTILKAGWDTSSKNLNKHTIRWNADNKQNGRIIGIKYNPIKSIDGSQLRMKDLHFIIGWE